MLAESVWPDLGMLGSMATDDFVPQLRSGNAFVDLSFWRKIAVSGAEALGWLNDLVSADIAGLEPNRARRALLLSPTGRIRAEFTVALRDGDILLMQDPAQPAAINALLAPYVLSSDVELADRTEELALFVFPGRVDPPEVPGTARSVPSITGVGADLMARAEQHDSMVRTLRQMYVLAGNEDLEHWRVIAGIPTFGVDATEEDLPDEGGFGGAVSYDKGCYLGQEAVAKVRNLGHPRRILLHVTAGERCAPGEPIESGGAEVGRITSAAQDGGAWWALAKVRWDAREAPLATQGGVQLSPASGG